MTSTAAAAVVEKAGIAMRILVFGPPSGQIQASIDKAAQINKKHGPFDALFVLGDLFAPSDARDRSEQQERDLVEGTITFPIKTYFMHSSTASQSILERLHSSFEDIESASSGRVTRIAENLYCIGRQGVARIGRSGPVDGSASEGLQVAWIGGTWNGALKGVPAEDAVKATFMTRNSIESLLSHPSFEDRDALIARAQAISSSSSTSNGAPATLKEAREAAQRATTSSEALTEAKAAIAAIPPIDILLTNAWPSGISLFVPEEKLPHPTARTWGSPAIATLLLRGKPRYCFSLAPGPDGGAMDLNGGAIDGIIGLDTSTRRTGVYFERAPYKNSPHAHVAASSTRFLSIARFGNADKKKWFGAFNLVPAIEMDRLQRAAAGKAPDGCTANPFGSSTPGGASGRSSQAEAFAKRERGNGEIDALDSGANYRWAGQPTRGRGKRIRRDPHDGGANGLPQKPDVPLPPGLSRRGPIIPVGPADCWFCLSNPQAAKHLIVSIGTECYISLPKGQLPSSSDADSNVPGGGHVLIVPIAHTPSIFAPEPSQSEALHAEMNAWRKAISLAFASFGSVAVSWEIGRSPGTNSTRIGHLQAQSVPVAKELAGESLEQFFRDSAKECGYVFEERAEEISRRLDTTQQDADERQKLGDYLRVDLGEKTWMLDMLPEMTGHFSLQFVRETLARYLKKPDRADWRKCARSDAIETAETNAFRDAFEPFAKEVVGEEEDG
ncbi:hypothetical protein IE81DRAFT_325926 [Ceraceosorus guamensis]|uniref:Cwf19-like C-terminal domain-containing protein n=1 Tax=Ceraceosorus guamensis TaxID=1522189 RepID=A0A316VUC8_9BASI|nr:hypothetical protein IE81DRAFT_325926 [Ceraceosorus guamensis]PWN40043.1 hypothetical protein IE81DRAFT_325926 [Ceraceosorus guamensis]